MELAASSYLAAGLTGEQYAELIPSYAKGDLLDLGSGKAPFFGAYRHHVETTTCADWPQTLHESPYLDVYCDLTRPLPFADESFDTVLLSDVLEHLPEPALAFREIARILRSQGMLILNTPFMYWVHEAPFDYYRHTRYSLERLAGSAGLEVVELKEVGGVLDVLVDVAAKALNQVPLLGRPIALGIQWIALRVGAHRPLSRVRAVSSRVLPLAHVLVAVKPG